MIPCIPHTVKRVCRVTLRAEHLSLVGDLRFARNDEAAKLTKEYQNPGRTYAGKCKAGAFPQVRHPVDSLYSHLRLC